MRKKGRGEGGGGRHWVHGVKKQVLWCGVVIPRIEFRMSF